MPADQRHLDRPNLQQTILTWLKQRLDNNDSQMLTSAFESLAGDAEDWEVFSSFSRVSQYTGKKPLNLTPDELDEAASLRSGWMPGRWTIDQLARTLLLLGLAEREKQEFLVKLDKLFISSDLGEGVALYQSLPVLPYPEDLTERAAEGIRTNITSVFKAVALHNPYPADFFNDDAWNQMILKSLFVGSPLFPILGVDKRSNEPLARMLVEYAHERWAAGREVSPELWRSVGPFIDDDIAKDIEKELAHEKPIHRYAAILALLDSSSDAVKELLQKYDTINEEVESKKITWDVIGRTFHKSE